MVADVDAKIDGITALDYNECNNLFQLIQNTASYTIRYDTILSVGRQPYPPFLGKRHCLMCISAASRPIA